MESYTTCVLTNMCMVYDENGNILVQNRRESDWPGITFPGGHIEKGESLLSAMIREMKEETGLEVSHLEIAGIIEFPSKKNTRYFTILYKTRFYQGNIKSSLEGDVFWIQRKDLSSYVLSDGFKEILEVYDHNEVVEPYLEGLTWN